MVILVNNSKTLVYFNGVLYRPGRTAIPNLKYEDAIKIGHPQWVEILNADPKPTVAKDETVQPEVKVNETEIKSPMGKVTLLKTGDAFAPTSAPNPEVEPTITVVGPANSKPEQNVVEQKPVEEVDKPVAEQSETPSDYLRNKFKKSKKK